MSKDQPASRNSELANSLFHIRDGQGLPSWARDVLTQAAAVVSETAHAIRSERGECAWTTDEDGVFYTRCGEAFTFIDAGPKENGMKWCCYCGGTLKEQQGERKGTEK